MDAKVEASGRPSLKALLTETIAGWGRHLDPQLAAALAFFSALALPPLLALTLAGAEAIFGQTSVETFLFQRLASTAGEEAARLLISAVAASHVGSGTGFATLAGVVGLFVAATGLVFQAQAALSHVFEYPRRSGIRHTLVARTIGLAAIAVAAAIVVAFFAALALVDALKVFGSASGAVGTASAAAAVFAAATMSYRWLSGKRVPWAAAAIGAVVMSAGTLLARYGLRVYFGLASVGSAYGSVGSVFVLLVWVYVLATIYLVGAEIARAWMVLTRGT